MRILGRVGVAPLAIGFVLLTLAWIAATPAFTGPDEPSHYERALTLAQGRLFGPKIRYGPEDYLTPQQEAGVDDDTRAIRVPAAMMPADTLCVDNRPNVSGCVVANPVGNFAPLGYVLPAVAIGLSSHARTALWLGRFVCALQSLAFLLLAIVLLSDGSAFSLLGFLAAATPMVFFSSAVINPSGIEIASCLAFVAALFRLTRDPEGSPLWVVTALGVSGVVALLTGPIDFAFVLLDVLAVGLLAGRASLRVLAGRWAVRWAAAACALAYALALVYTRLAGFLEKFGFSPFWASLHGGLEQFRLLMPQAIGNFASLTVPLPLAIDWIWWALALLMIGGALLVGRPRERLAMVVTTILCLAFPILYWAWSDRYSGFGLAGRPVLPELMLIPLVAGEILLRRRDRFDSALAPLGLAGAMATFVAIDVYAWWRSARVAARAPGFLRFWAHAAARPPLGWYPWLAAAGLAALLMLGWVLLGLLSAVDRVGLVELRNAWSRAWAPENSTVATLSVAGTPGGLAPSASPASPDPPRTPPERDRLPRLSAAARRVEGSAITMRVRSHPNLLALLLYAVAAVYLQQHALSRLSSGCGCLGLDPTLFIWSLKWWPYAITHGVNPFVTNRIWSPHVAFDLATNTTVPLPAIVAWPLTALTSPTVSYNVLMTIAPILGAWCAYRLCRYVTGSPWASVLGGYLFGFSSFAIGESAGHLQLVFDFAAPLAVLLTLKRLDGLITVRRYVILMALTQIAELLCGTEIELTMTLLGAVALLAGWLFSGSEGRRRIVQVLPPLVLAYVAMAVVCSPFLYYLLTGPPVAVGRGQMFSADALSFLIPTPVTLIGGHRAAAVSSAYPENLVEAGTYVGFIVVLIVIGYLSRWRRTPRGRVLISVLAVAVVWSLGKLFYVDGHPLFSLPWRALEKLPGLNQVLPVRIGEYVALICGLIVALWLSERGARRWWRSLVALLAVAMLLPNPDADYPGTTARGGNVFNDPIHTPSFFTTADYRRYLKPGEVIVPVPYALDGPALVWQADDDMYWRQASGNFYLPNQFGYDTFAQELLGGTPTAIIPKLMRQFVARNDVGAFVVDPLLASAYPAELRKDGFPKPVSVGGVLVYDVPKAWRRTPVPRLPIPKGCSPSAATCT